MKEKKVIQHYLSSGRKIVLLVDRNTWFIEYTTRELPKEIKDNITENINDAEILRKFLL